MLELDQTTTELLASVEPPLPHALRELVLKRGLAETHKDAHERFVGPYLAYLASQQATIETLKL